MRGACGPPLHRRDAPENGPRTELKRSGSNVDEPTVTVIQLQPPAHASTPVQAAEKVAPATSAEQAFVVEIREELDTYFVQLRQLGRLPGDEVFLTLAGITARLAEIRSYIVRIDSRRMTALRSREIDPLIEECERQFRFFSRAQTVRQYEADLTRGI